MFPVTRWTPRAEATALAALAVLPIVPYVLFLLRTGVPRFTLFGDFALLDHATRHVWLGDTLLGPYSRYSWNHPGPLFFFIAAPFQALFGSASTGLYIATCFVNGSAAATIPFWTRLAASRAHALAALVVVFGWFMAFGDISANPWNPLVVALPLLAFLVVAAMFARGKSAAVYPFVIFGALVAQMHIAAASTVVVVGAVALASFLVGSYRRRTSTRDGWLAPQDRRRLSMATALLFVLCFPPIVEQLTAETGNLTKLWRFFAHRAEPLKPPTVAAQHWMRAASWMPDRILSCSLLEDEHTPLAMRWDPLPDGLTPTARTIALVQVAMVIVCGAIAARRRDVESAFILACGAIATAVSLSALAAIVGLSYHYLVFWTAAASGVTWIGVLATLFSALGAGASLNWPRVREVVATAPILIGVMAAIPTTLLQRAWLAKHPVAPASRPHEATDLRAVYDALRSRLARDGTTAVVHSDGAWDVANALVLELEKDGVEVTVSERDHWTYVGLRAGTELKSPLHVYPSTTPLPLPVAGCLELIAKSGDFSIYGAPIATSRCPAP